MHILLTTQYSLPCSFNGAGGRLSRKIGAESSMGVGGTGWGKCGSMCSSGGVFGAGCCCVSVIPKWNYGFLRGERVERVTGMSQSEEWGKTNIWKRS